MVALLSCCLVNTLLPLYHTHSFLTTQPSEIRELIRHLEWKPGESILTKTKAKVYVETSVISYLTARPSRDIIIAGHQQITYDWWQTCHDRFELLASQLVIQEASKGDPDASQARLDVLNIASCITT